MDYPFRYDKKTVGDECWWLSQEGPIKSTIVDKHDNYFNLDPKIHVRGNQSDYLIDYWIDNYDSHGLVFGSDLFETEEECFKMMFELGWSTFDWNSIVFTNGCFDILHPGHIGLLEFASKFGKVIIGLNSDKSIKKIKPGRPIQKYSDRFKVLKSIKYVTHIISFNEETPIELLKTIKPSILIKGSDWENKNDICFDYVLSYGGKVIFYPYESKWSTTNIITKIKNNKDI